MRLWKCYDGTYDIVDDDGDIVFENVPEQTLAAAPKLLAALNVAHLLLHGLLTDNQLDFKQPDGLTARERLHIIDVAIAEAGKPHATHVRVIKQSDIGKCPHVIFMAEHYREDGTCKCNDPNDKLMSEWGYTWRDGAWR